ncbi:hypothetical protein [Saccharopolyspora elongata]|uniref:hypothetical protein n=1 Tax=Saccharopolyspora elongata TaxID=2530387 RepID=UPI001F1A36E2|nr:hypothetical protein [Saccharopolyspora elongata]
MTRSTPPRTYATRGARDGHGIYGAIFTYNHADWYVRKVLDQANAYKAVQQSTP